MKQQTNMQNDLVTASSHIGIRGKLVAGFVALILLFAISTLSVIVLVGNVKSDSNNFLTLSIPTEHSIIDLHANIDAIQIQVLKYVLANNSTSKQVAGKLITTLNSQMITVNNLIKSMNDPHIYQRWVLLGTMITKYSEHVTKVLEMNSAAVNGSNAAINYLQSDIIPLLDDMNTSFNTIGNDAGNTAGVLDMIGNSLSSDMTDINNQIYWIYISRIFFMAFVIIFSLLIAFITARSIVKPIHYAINIAKQITAGKRDMTIETNRGDEIGQLLNSMSIMLNSIKSGEAKIAQNATDIMQACSSMVTTLEEVRHAVDAQSSGASEQASSINEITASITEIEKSALQTLNKAKDLGGVAEKTRKSGQLGVEAIDSSVLGMKSVKDKVQLIAQTILDLSRQTQQVGEITSVVNNMAQQSKMLALNASIEAAKAGDAGKGFAVVAVEVKNLAEQSESSTSQVQKILEDIRIATEKAVMVTEEGTKGVETGLEMIERTGEIIRDLNDVIREASIASQQIEAAVRQEGAGIEQITAGMNEINIVTSAFVDSVSQTTEAMNNLAQVTQKLKDSVDTINS
ncbi:MAG TPA: methyl-accepting chemotaxis protein [Gammaproteobacteria bacterium]|jgi:methyl-accepting chemotaxis protein|nr:methyl-accepting chemotaxis protein [Gammaproteobacteria bacterium]